MRSGAFPVGILLGLCIAVGVPSAGVQAEGEEEAPQATPTPKPKPAKKQETHLPSVALAKGGQRGLASWYRTKRVLAAAHRTLPFGTKVKVSTDNGRSVIVTIMGRGPFRKERVIDLSSDAFKKLASLGAGILRVKVQRVQ
ncbi:MAG: septal ring lytic transglycosylase RlpA family protein [bacterium]|nr:septal ring lytic transglycosylase RlpA family protein [bacterium]